MNTILNNNPSITFWRMAHQRHTNFAIENQSQPFQGYGYIGSGPSQYTFSRSGDLIYHLYCVVDLPGICNVVIHPTEGCQEIVDSKLHKLHYEGSETDATLKVISSQSKHLHSSIIDPETKPAEPTGDAKAVAEAKRIGRYVPYWTNAVGQYLVKKATLFIGSQPIDQIFGDFLFMMEELCGKPGRRLTEMIGKYDKPHEIRQRSKYFQRLYVPLPFFFTKSSGCALPLVSLQFHDVMLQVEWNDVKDAIVNSSGLDSGRITYDCTYTDTPGGTPKTKTLPVTTIVRPGQRRVEFKASGRSILPLVAIDDTLRPPPIKNEDVKVGLECTFIYLDQLERTKFAEGSFEILMDECQQQPCPAPRDGTSIPLQLQFNHAVIEILWAVRTHTSLSRNQHFNYWGSTCKFTGKPIDPVRSAQLRLNNQTRHDEAEGRYFRLVQPYQHHTNIPNAAVYSYSFALHPEDAQPSGSCNFSRIDNSHLTLNLDATMMREEESVQIILFARNWNVLRVTMGLAGKAFAN